jgi:branched-chain amino acid transport system substrate-binding protein
MITTSRLAITFLFAGLLAAGNSGAADRKYGPGVTDTEIKIGQTMPYSGPASAYSTTGKAEAAYFKMINDQGGVNGRKITLLSLDDGYSPPKTVEQTRRLVEQEQVLLIFSSLGTAANSAIYKYLNINSVPHLFFHSAALKWGDPANYPWTIPWAPNQRHEVNAYGRYILDNRPDAKIAVLYQNDDFGKGYLTSLREFLGERADRMMVAQASYEATDPTIDSQIVSLKASGADVLLLAANPRFVAQAIRKTHDLGWMPLRFVGFPGASVGSALAPAGLDKAAGLISSAFAKDPTDPQWKNDPEFKEWLAWMKRYYPEGDVTDMLNVWGYVTAEMLVQVLRQCADDLTRENALRQAANLRGPEIRMLLPGVRVSTSPTDYHPIKQVQLMKFDGKQWARFGGVLGEETAGK